MVTIRYWYFFCKQFCFLIFFCDRFINCFLISKTVHIILIKSLKIQNWTKFSRLRDYNPLPLYPILTFTFQKHSTILILIWKIILYFFHYFFYKFFVFHYFVFSTSYKIFAFFSNFTHSNFCFF